ncbi:glycoside hydrolase family 2 protein [Pseudolysinimonas sp.]|uniref:glycoside hydrolase family 2 protein n=1 Tax=Pseudolysinimonas sp. TaxID=2680009 RepID=UPI003F7ED8CA
MTDDVVPRSEYPRPQLRRDRWLCLNGEWDFAVDRADTGLERGLLATPFDRRITVPFAPESIASGIGDVDFMAAVWYRRMVRIPDDWAGDDVLLHFGAVDHDATVWVDGVEVARHRGGFTGFTAELGGLTAGAEHEIVVRARDTRDEPQARGKQATWYENTACFYTRTTGIWQTVWMEPVPRTRIRRIRTTPQLATRSFAVGTTIDHPVRGLRIRAELRDAGGVVTTAECDAGLDLAPTLTLVVPDARVRPWSPQDPHLYDLQVDLLRDGDLVDRVVSYAGLRSIAIDGERILLNGRPVFQRLVLDQGLWPDTLMTAPSDEALARDIELGIAAGFNGARLHQKVFEERYLYHADRLGYLVWGEFGDWGATRPGAAPEDRQFPTASFVTEWLEALERDHSHPSIVGWCPLNETYQALGDRITQLDDVTHAMYLATKLADPSRPVLDASGYAHRVRGADVYDAHDYEQDPTAFARTHGVGSAPYVNRLGDRDMSIPYAGQPYFVSEYGGIWWNPAIAGADPAGSDDERGESWGYGQRVTDVESWHRRFDGLTEVLLGNPAMFGYCYTQLTDTFQEQNGLYTDAREPKFDIARIAATQRRVAAFEEELR